MGNWVQISSNKEWIDPYNPDKILSKAILF